MAQNIIEKHTNNKPLTAQEQEFIQEIRSNPNHEAFKELWVAGLI